jgi:predicted AlkP superfamily pyrophosphatase or phosphodiesterase
MRKILSPALCAALAVFAPLAAAHAAVTPTLRASRAVVISIDGLRPDVLMQSDAPVIHGLMASGSFTLRARTTETCVTLPSHVSMLTGVPPEEHGVTWNGDRPPANRRHPLKPTLFDVAHQAGLTTAMVAGKLKFQALETPGALDWSRVRKTKDVMVADTAVRWIEEHAPQVMFVHLPGVDWSGHFWGWGSGAQRAAVATADRCVGRVLEALRARGVLDSTVVVVTSDHGGVGRSHPPSDPRSQFIPWIVSGPGIHANLDLAHGTGSEVVTEDTFATVCALLGLVPRQPIKGRLVERILIERVPTP